MYVYLTQIAGTRCCSILEIKRVAGNINTCTVFLSEEHRIECVQRIVVAHT